MARIQTEPAPHCPLDGARMVLRRPTPPDTWKAFWGCMNYPDCKGKRTIGIDGKPEGDTPDWDNVLDEMNEEDD